MGLGDAKLLAMIGAFLGYEASIFSLFAGAIQGLIIGGGLLIINRMSRQSSGSLRKQKIPFGPFLAMGALEYFFWGRQIINGYIGMFSDILQWLNIISYN